MHDKITSAEFTAPRMQHTWGRPAVANLALGSTGAGIYLIGHLLVILGQDRPDLVQLVSFQLLAPIIVCCGFFALSLEAGRPSRAFHLFRNIFSSWMSIESFAGIFFIIASFTGWFFPHFILKIVAILAALLLIISQGFMVYRAPAVTAWNVPLVPVIFTTSGFMTACGMILLNTLTAQGENHLPVVISMIIVPLNLGVWLLYLYGNHNADFKKATENIRRSNSLLVTGGIGHLLPMALLLLTFVLRNSDNSSVMLPIVYVISGLALIVGGVSQKNGVILKAGYFKGIVLRPTEEQGSLFP